MGSPEQSDIEHPHQHAPPPRRSIPTTWRPVPLGNSVSCCELGFAAVSAAWLGPSRGAVVARLPLAEIPVRPAGGAGPSDLSKDAELLVLRHENQLLRRQLSGRLRWDHADRLWLTELSRLGNRRRWPEIFLVAPATNLTGTVISSPASGPTPTGAGQDDRPPVFRSRR